MNCECGCVSKTTDTRKIPEGVWRKRQCLWCGKKFTTLEQVCETVASPYRNGKTGEARPGVVIAPGTVPPVPRPNPPEKRAVAKRRDDFKPAEFAPKPKQTHWNAGRAPAAPAVDRHEPTARDRIEDMKADRDNTGYGWEK